MDRFRLIVSIVALYVYLLAMYPIPTVITSLVLLIAYLVLRNINAKNFEEVGIVDDGRTLRRKAALKEAKIYLAPYSDIWKYLKLSNKYCILHLGANEKTITARDKISKRSLKVIESKVHSYTDLWDMFCHSFSHNTTFDRLIELCHTYKVSVSINGENAQTQIQTNIQPSQLTKTLSESSQNEKIDINNASEIEITALPGISIVLAKKLIKKREEIGGFKTIDDVCLFLKLKPHMETQLKELICVNKIKVSKNLKRYNERSIDL